MIRVQRNCRRFIAIALLLLVSSSAGCAGRIFDMVTESEEHGDKFQGITYYVGGAGPIGHIGSYDVPNGLRDAGYDGYFQVFNWQSWTHAGDQINIKRNHEKASELASMIRRYRRRYPRGKINIIALSAGAGIVTFALEYLPEDINLNNVVYLSCSMSSQYDLSRTLRRISGHLYVIYSPTDRVLNNVVWYTGTVDRTSAKDGVAGLEGFREPRYARGDTASQYRKLRNIVYRPEFADYDYRGGHTDSTKREFIRFYVARALMGDDSALMGDYDNRKSRPPAFPAPKSTPRATSPHRAERGSSSDEKSKMNSRQRPTRTTSQPQTRIKAEDEENKPSSEGAAEKPSTSTQKKKSTSSLNRVND